MKIKTKMIEDQTETIRKLKEVSLLRITRQSLITVRGGGGETTKWEVKFYPNKKLCVWGEGGG